MNLLTIEVPYKPETLPYNGNVSLLAIHFNGKYDESMAMGRLHEMVHAYQWPQDWKRSMCDQLDDAHGS